MPYEIHPEGGAALDLHATMLASQPLNPRLHLRRSRIIAAIFAFTLHLSRYRCGIDLQYSRYCLLLLPDIEECFHPVPVGLGEVPVPRSWYLWHVSLSPKNIALQKGIFEIRGLR